MTEHTGDSALPIADLLWLLRGSRLTLDAIAEGREGPEHAAAQAQRIVDHLGHDVTDEPPHTLVENERLVGELERSNALRSILNDAVREGRSERDRLREVLSAIAEWDGSQGLGYEGPRDLARAALSGRSDSDGAR